MHKDATLRFCLAAVLAVPALGRSADDDPSAVDMKALQGAWVSVGEEVGGKALTKVQLKDMNKRLTVKGNQFTIKRVAGDKLAVYEGRFELDATREPKAFDWTGKLPNGAAAELQGIYELSGGMFRVCYSIVGPDTTRPKAFKTSEKSGFILVKYKPDGDE